jgi:hypothetical protein
MNTLRRTEGDAASVSCVPPRNPKNAGSSGSVHGARNIRIPAMKAGIAREAVIMAYR